MNYISYKNHFDIIENNLLAHDNICIPITFNNPLKVYFSNKTYLITIQTRLTQIVKICFFFKNRFLTDF